MLIKSKKYESGEIKTTGFGVIGTNRGLIKIKGNFIKMVSIIVDAGVSVGGTERIKLKDENEKAASIIAGTMITIFIETHNPKKIIPKSKGTMENKHPNRKELHTFPNKIVLIEIGHVIKRSNVFCLVSQGKTTGPMLVEVRNSTIAIKPDII